MKNEKNGGAKIFKIGGEEEDGPPLVRCPPPKDYNFPGGGLGPGCGFSFTQGGKAKDTAGERVARALGEGKDDWGKGVSGRGRAGKREPAGGAKGKKAKGKKTFFDKHTLPLPPAFPLLLAFPQIFLGRFVPRFH